MKKTVMHLIATSFFGGPEKQITEHLTRLNSGGKYQGILTSFLEGSEENETLARARQMELRHCEINMAGPLDIRALFHLKSLLKSNNVDLLCTHGYKSVVMGCLAAKMNGIPVVAFSRGYTSENFKVRFYEWLERQFLAKSDGVICVSGGQQKRLRELEVKGKKNWVVHNAVSVFSSPPHSDDNFFDNLKTEFDIPKQSLILVTAGRFSPEKGHHYLLQALSLIKDKLPHAYLLLCGDGMCKNELLETAKKLGIIDRCKFVGFRRDLEKIFKEMDLFVLPSLTEGLPNVILESFACSKPVVATKVGGVPEIVTNETNGILVPPQAPEQMAKAIIKLGNNSEKRKEMGRAGYQAVRRHFSFEQQNQKLTAIYEQILAQ